MRPFVLTIVTILSLGSMTPADDAPVYTLDNLACRSWCELEAIYRAASPGNAPCGFFRGRTVYRKSEHLSGPREAITNFAWQGKHFTDGALINQFRGLKLIRAEVGPGDSWLDGRPAHILDYRDTSVLWRDVRDEMREVSPGVYVGAMYLHRCPEPRLKVLFILERDSCR